MSSDLPPMGIGLDLMTRTFSGSTDTLTNEDRAMRTLSACTDTPLARTNKDRATRTLSARTDTPLALTNEDPACTNTPLSRTDTPLAHTNKDQATRTLSARTPLALTNEDPAHTNTPLVHTNKDLAARTGSMPTEDFSLNSESDVSGASFSDDDDISEASDNHMSTISIDNSARHETDGDDDQAIAMNPAGIETGVEIGLGFEAPGDGFLEGSPATDGLAGTADYTCPADDPRAIPKGRSIAHLAMKDEKAVYMSFDIEIAGEAAGIIQISAEIFRIRIVAGGGIGKDRIDDVVCSPNVFNSYVRPWRRRHAEHLQWGVLYAKSQYAKSAGKRGTINMHNFT